MLEVYEDHKKYYSQVVEFATKVGALEELTKTVDYLSTFACRKEDGSIDPTKSKCVLYKDFAPNSFEFVMYRRKDRPLIKTEGLRDQDGYIEYERWFNGGMIYSGPGLPSDGSFPSFTVSLDRDANSGNRHMWSVHT